MTKRLLKSSIITLILIMTFMINVVVFASGPFVSTVKVFVKIETKNGDMIDDALKFKLRVVGKPGYATIDTENGVYENKAVTAKNITITPDENPYTFDSEVYFSDKEIYVGSMVDQQVTQISIAYKLAKIVTFDTDGGSEVKTKYVRSEEKVEEPSIPTKTGYKFQGWKLNDDIYDFSKPVTEDITLVAVWSENTTDPDPVDPVDPNPEPKPEEPETKPDKDNTDYSSILWNWRHDSTVEIKTSTHRAYVNGYPDGTIRPQGEITRGEVAAIIARLHADAADVDYGVETNYSDVQSTDWYAKYISYVSDKGLMKGYEDESFRPEEKISRAEYATVVARFKGLDEVDSKFDDSKEHWAEGYIGAVYSKGWISGYPDGTFKPNANISREEVVKMTNGMLDRKVNTEGLGELSINKFTDLEYGTWSYYEMIEASNSHKYLDDKKESETWKEVL